MVHVKKVNLAYPMNVDNIVVKKDHYFPKAYVIDFPLDSQPDHVWQDIFEKEWRTSRHLWDRKIFVVGDILRLVTTPEEIAEKVSWVKEVISITNKNVENYNKQMSVSDEAKPQTQRALIEHEETIENIRRALRDALHTV